MFSTVKIQLPLSYAEDARATHFKLYKKDGDNLPAYVFQTSVIGTEEIIDVKATFGCSYYYSACNPANNAESHSSPITRIFKRRNSTPKQTNNLLNIGWALYTKTVDFTQLKESPCNIFVLDYSSDSYDTGAFSPDIIRDARWFGNTIYGYISLGMAEKNRFYSGYYFNVTDTPLLHGANPRNSNQYNVEFWSSLWLSHMKNYLDKLLEAEFSGVYFDNVNSYLNMVNIRSTGFDDMLFLINTLIEYAHTREPEFKILVDKGENFRVNNNFVSKITGLVRNEVYYFGHDLIRNDNVQGRGLNLDTETTEVIEDKLDDFRSRSNNKPVFVYDHTLQKASSYTAIIRATLKGYTPYTTQVEHNILRVVV